MNSSNSNSSDSNNNGKSNGIDLGSRDLALHFLDRARLGSSGGPSDMEEDEPAPAELNTINSSGGFLVVSPDKLSLKYTGVNLHGHDVGVVQANKPAPVKRLVYYFEIFVKDAGAKGQVAIGFTNESFKMRRQPGWEVNSFGYHGDDGCLYRGQGKGDAYGPTYTTGDTVGGGINYSSQEFFFTKNGAIVGTPVYKDVKGPLFPTVAVHSQNEEVHVNFGQKKFAFDVKEYEAQERMKQQMKVDQTCLPPNVSHGNATLLPPPLHPQPSKMLLDFSSFVYPSIFSLSISSHSTKHDFGLGAYLIASNPFLLGRLVRSYLLHYGYEDTLNAFDLASKSTVPPICVAQENGFDEQEIVYALNERKTLRQLIRSGQIEMAFSNLRDWYPQIVQDDKSATCFLLHCQHFIELVRVGRLEEAVKYGRIELAKFFGMSGFEELVKECVALLAYERPEVSPVGYLLKESQREVVADTVNAMVLSTNPSMKDRRDCLHSYLERLLRQLTACSLERRSMNGDQGEAFHLHQVLERTKC